MRTNKSKAKPVISWLCQRQAGSMKALQRVVWSSIFLVFGVLMVSAEEQGVQVQQRIEKDLGQTPRGVEVRWKRMHSCECYEWKWYKRVFCKNEKKRETARVRTQEPLMETAKVETLVPLKQTARDRIQAPSKNQLKGGEFGRSGRKISGRKRRRKRRRRRRRKK